MTSDATTYAAVRGWLSLSGERLSTERVELLSHGRDTSVYRLHSEDGPVIAKNCPAATGALERTIYEQFLTKLPLPTLRYYGLAWESAREFCWLFIEDAGGARYEPDCEAHRIAAARTLSRLILRRVLEAS